MSQIDNIFIQVRARLRSEGIKLWEEPYYSEDLGSIEAAMENLAAKYSDYFGIASDHCKCVLTELQDNALRKLAARQEFSVTGMATFKVRRIDNRGGTTTMLDIKCDLNSLGSDLQAAIADKLKLPDANHVKCIAGGKMVASNVTLSAQQLKNNQQLIVIVGQADNRNGALYERINRIKKDVETVVSSDNQMMEMEDQNGSPVFLPPAENRALLMGLGFCEKARAAMQREDYEEALLLLLEADERFATCNSQFLESVDNYALLNLDIVWCYLCLKNVTQLPDADRRLGICEKSFKRSYGEGFKRLYSLKGKACPERALIMRLHLLQGVVLFHQNRRDEAFERFEQASALLGELKVNEHDLTTLMEMGFELSESRLALRSCSGSRDVGQAIQFIQERRQQLKNARKQSKAERSMQRKYNRSKNKDCDWVNPRSICTLTEMGFDRRLAKLALQRSNNDVPQAVELLQTQFDDLVSALPRTSVSADDDQLKHLLHLGFEETAVRAALESTHNDVERAIEFLLRSFQTEEELKETMDRIRNLSIQENEPSTSSSSLSSMSPLLSPIMNSVLRQAQEEIDAMQAYQRFNSDINQNDQDYLDLPLVLEEQLLAEYRHLLEQ
ncbi:NEDD8 ultimate buster 1 [Drosophila bipectinata]|uniref:NEDD8 ultimate buster 1 n=1 Tax=Drosophila bipectinata TaxID=42026 RepID=UPI001C896664|nr:NEDD8 ultimate buster 1 [Drosophila bipectinata]